MFVHIVVVETGGSRPRLFVYDTRAGAETRANLERMHFPVRIETHPVSISPRPQPPSVEKFEVG